MGRTTHNRPFLLPLQALACNQQQSLRVQQQRAPGGWPGSLGSRLPPPRGRALHPPLPFSAPHPPAPQLSPMSGSLQPDSPPPPPEPTSCPRHPRKREAPLGCSHPWWPPETPPEGRPVPVLPACAWRGGGQGDTGGRGGDLLSGRLEGSRVGVPTLGLKPRLRPSSHEESSEVLGAGQRSEEEGHLQGMSLQCSVVGHRPMHKVVGGGSESQWRAPGPDSRYEAQPDLRNPGLVSHPGCHFVPGQDDERGRLVANTGHLTPQGDLIHPSSLRFSVVGLWPLVVTSSISQDRWVSG